MGREGREPGFPRLSLLALLFFFLVFQLSPVFSPTYEASGAVQRVVIAELFTATWCGFCPYATDAINKLAEEYGSSLAVLQYHPQNSDPFGNKETDARIASYGIDGYPTMIFDGTVREVGGYDETYAQYKRIIESRLESPTEVSIALNGNLGNFTAEVAVSSLLPQLSAKVRFVVYEKDIPYDAPNGEKIFTFTVRRILEEEPISLTAGQKISIRRGVQPELGLDINKMGAVVFVQKDNTREILQAATFIVETLPLPGSPGFSFTSGEITRRIKPDETANFSATIKNLGDTSDTYEITTLKSLPAEWEAGFCLGTMCYWNSASVTLQPGSTQIIEVFIVSRDLAGIGNITVTVSSEGDPSHARHIVFNADAESSTESQLPKTIAIALTVAGLTVVSVMLWFWARKYREHTLQNPKDPLHSQT